MPDAQIRLFPSFNSLQLLAQNLLMPYHDMRIVSLTGRPWHEFDRTLIESASKIGVLTDREHTPTTIARRMLDIIGGRMAQQGITLQADDDAVAALAKDGFDARYGARPLRRYVQHTVETMLSKRLLRGDVTPGQTVTVDAENGELVMK